MKKFLILLIIVCFILTANAQKTITKNDVPPKVMEKALQIRPEITLERLNIKWQKEGINYKVITPGIRGDKFPSSTVIDSAGTFLWLEDFIEPQDLPLKARDYLLGHDPSVIISEAYKVMVLDEHFITTFRAVVTSRPRFDKDGNLLPPKK